MEARLTELYKNYLRFKNDEFQNLRGFMILQLHGKLTPSGLRRLMDIMDEVRELKLGETIFCVPSENEPYAKRSMQAIEETGNMMERAHMRHECDGKLSAYRPIWNYAFAIKRTETGWIHRNIDYKYI